MRFLYDFLEVLGSSYESDIHMEGSAWKELFVRVLFTLWLLMKFGDIAEWAMKERAIMWDGGYALYYLASVS